MGAGPIHMSKSRFGGTGASLVDPPAPPLGAITSRRVILPIRPLRTSSQPNRQWPELRCCVPYWNTRLFSSNTLRQTKSCSTLTPSGFST